MKRRLLILSLSAGAMARIAPSYAQGVPVIDIASITQIVNQLQQMKQDYQVYTGIFGSLVREFDPNSVASYLRAGSNPMPAVPQIAGLLNGSGNYGALSGLANQSLKDNTYYLPQSTGADDFNAQILQRMANSSAGGQAAAQQSLISIQTHIAALNEIQDQLSTATSQADLTAINGRIAAEQANLAAQGVQAQSLNAMLAGQQKQFDQMELQKQRRDADALAESVGGGTVPAATQIPAAQIPTFSAGG